MNNTITVKVIFTRSGAKATHKQNRDERVAKIITQLKMQLPGQ